MATGSGTGTAASAAGTTTFTTLIDRIKRSFTGTVSDRVVKAAINQAIRAAEHWLIPTTDTTTVTADDEDFDYSLPTDLVQLLQVWTRDDTDERWVEVPPFQWRVTGTPGSQVLYFDSMGGMDDGDTVRLEYLKRLSELTATSDTLGIGAPMEPMVENYVTEYALSVLYDYQAGRYASAEAFAPHTALSQTHFRKAQGILRMAMRGRPAGRIHGGYPNRSIG